MYSETRMAHPPNHLITIFQAATATVHQLLSDQTIMATSVSDREDVFEVEDIAPDQCPLVWILRKGIKPACFTVLS